MIITTHNKHKITVKKQCRFHGIACRQIARWLNPPEKKKKVALVEVDMVLEEFRRLMGVELESLPLLHAGRRSYGSGELHDKLKGKIPRREVQKIINDLRREFNRGQSNEYTRVSWNGNMTCWAMDDTHLYTDENGVKQWIHNVKDLNSQYILPPVAGRIMSGEEVAENLRQLFKCFGAPLVLKRDNGSNLCCAAMDNVLDEFNVIPLTSPAYYSRYNGSVEQSNCWLKKRVNLVSEIYKCPVNKQTAPVICALAAHEENTQHKRSTGYKTPSYQFFKGNTNNPKINVRREVISDINEYITILTQECMPRTKQEKNSIKRKATEAVLEKRGYINVVKSEEVSPLF